MQLEGEEQNFEKIQRVKNPPRELCCIFIVSLRLDQNEMSTTSRWFVVKKFINKIHKPLLYTRCKISNSVLPGGMDEL